MSNPPTTLICYCNWAHSFGVSICFWLPNCDFHRTLFLWDKFEINQQLKNKAPVFEVGRVRQSGSKIYINPIKEAIKYKEYLDRGEAKSQADLARKWSVARVKVTQMLNLLKLDEEILDFMLGLEETDKMIGILTERMLRPLMQIPNREIQRRKFWEMVGVERNFQVEGEEVQEKILTSADSWCIVHILKSDRQQENQSYK